MRRLHVAMLILHLCLCAVSQDQSNAPDWKPLSFLVGNWTLGEGGSQLRKADSGGSSFHLDLRNRVLIRRNFADYPARDGEAAYHHEDLMVIYPLADTHAFAAIYFDSEGHTIRYDVRPDAGGHSVTFLSEAEAGKPRFRLTYTKTAVGLEGNFEIAAPDKPNSFAPHLHWTIQAK